MREVGAFEAKNKLGQLLDLVEQPRHKIGRDEARAAIRRIRERAEQRKLGRFDWSEWKAFRDAGRG
jgi:hypothetical protein